MTGLKSRMRKLQASVDDKSERVIVLEAYGKVEEGVTDHQLARAGIKRRKGDLLVMINMLAVEGSDDPRRGQAFLHCMTECGPAGRTRYYSHEDGSEIPNPYSRRAKTA